MKTKLLTETTMLAMTSIFLCACINHINDEIVPGNVPISFKASIKSEKKTRMSNNTFDIGDEVGLYAFITNGNSYIQNMPLKYNENAQLIPSTDLFYPTGDTSLDFLAYYPYQQNDNQNEINFSIQSDQSDDENFALSDLLIAEKEKVKSTSNPVKLEFAHKLVKMKIQIVPNEGETAEELLTSNPSVSVFGFKSEGTYNIQERALTTGSTTATITPHGNWKVEDGNLTGKEFIVMPETEASMNPYLVIEINGQVNTCKITPKTIEGGTQCNIIIKASNNELMGIIGDIKEWVNGEDIDTGSSVENSFIHIPTLSFNTSDIYRVYKNGMPVLDICKEYLYANGADNNINSQAIVAYPVKGYKPDMSNGTVLQLLDMEGNVHGGKAVWNKEENSLTYTPGTKPLIECIYIDQNGELSFSPSDTDVQIIISSYKIRDIRGSEIQIYPIVKIGTQYWMKENLRATKYNNGQDIDLGTMQGTQAQYFKDADNNSYFYSGYVLLESNMAPIGWKIPDTEDWNRLKTYVNDEAALLKAGTWKPFNTGDELQPANNRSGFNALPLGLWDKDKMISKGTVAGFWTQEEDGSIPQYTTFFNGSEAGFVPQVSSIATGQEYYKVLSIRCIATE